MALNRKIRFNTDEIICDNYNNVLEKFVYLSKNKNKIKNNNCNTNDYAVGKANQMFIVRTKRIY